MSSDRIDTRHRILDAALKLLEDRSGSAVRMADIAKAAGVSRQAVYLHFPNRADLLIEATRHVDKVRNIDARLEKSRKATDGLERLDAFVEAWGNYIPEIWGVARALIAMKESDSEAGAAWKDRMDAVRHGCAAAVRALETSNQLRSDLDTEMATDLLAMLLSVPNWEQLTQQNGWSQRDYISRMQTAARQLLTNASA